MRPIDEPMSHHELLWWQAYASLRPLQPNREDIAEARIVGVMSGKSPKEVKIDWFDPELDPELKRKRVQEDLEEIRAYKAKRLKDGKANRRNNT